MRLSLPLAAALSAAGLIASPAAGDDWPTFGRDRTHNAVSSEKGAPTNWQVPATADKSAIDKGVKPLTDSKSIAWMARIGSRGIGGPVVAGGLVWAGTNNEHPRDPNDFRVRKNGRKEPIDKSVLICFRESDGKFLWQYAVPRTADGGAMYRDHPYQAMGSTPLVEGDRLWLVNNQSEVVCLDIGPLWRGLGEPKEVWKVNLQKQFGVIPHAALMAGGLIASVAADGERLYVATGNGQDDSFERVAAPNAPSLVCLEKTSGKTVWTDNSPGKGILMYQFSSPLVATVNGRGLVIHGQGDGWLRAFDVITGKRVWACDLNTKDAKWMWGGKGTRNAIAATPVWYENRVYVGMGIDPEHVDGVGWIFCIDPTKEGDVSPEIEVSTGKGKPNPNSAVVWRYGGLEKDPDKAGRDFVFGRTLGNCTLHDGLCYACDQMGYLQCLDARTGRHYWTHDTKSEVWGSPLWADGKVYLATTDGDVWVFAHGREAKLIAKIDVLKPVHSTPVFANCTLYVMTESLLCAIREQK
jgi:outer membrane protein assembly factor BamB